jgi:hypothetical protein
MAMDYSGLFWLTMDYYGLLCYSIIIINIFLVVIVSSEKKTAKLWKPNVPAIQKTFDSTGDSKSKIASAGNMNQKTFNKCFKHNAKLILAKANGVVNGLNNCGANPPVTREMLFSPVDEDENKA